MKYLLLIVLKCNWENLNSTKKMSMKLKDKANLKSNYLWNFNETDDIFSGFVGVVALLQCSQLILSRRHRFGFLQQLILSTRSTLFRGKRIQLLNAMKDIFSDVVATFWQLVASISTYSPSLAWRTSKYYRGKNGGHWKFRNSHFYLEQ